MSLPAQTQVLTWGAISEIAVNPEYANHLWIAIGGYWPASHTTTHGINRVFTSGDGGSTWSDFTFNLLAFPVISLIYQRGSNGVLFAGTDVGVFRYKPALQSWECFTNQLPVVPVTSLEINYCKNKIRAATWSTSLDLSYTGAIVQAENAIFYNNRRSVQLLSYHSGTGLNEANNLSRFKSCTFETNRRLNDPTLRPYTHVSMDDVKGVTLYGCRFNDTAPAGVFGVNDRGVGVESVDAVPRLDDLYSSINTSSVVAPSVFNGLTYGVRADFTAGVNKGVTILSSDFNNVRRGVQIQNSIGSLVKGNSFNALPNAATASFTDATWGIRLNGASNLSVLANTVTGPALPLRTVTA